MSGLSFDRDSDLSLDVAGLEVFVGGGGLSKRVGLRESGNGDPIGNTMLARLVQGAVIVKRLFDPRYTE